MPLRRDALRPLPTLPPGFRLITLRENEDAFTRACAKAGELEPATIVWTPRFHLLEFAVVLQPDEPLATAWRAFYAGMSSLADAVAAHGPPDRPAQFVWPDTLMFDGARLGGGRLGWPVECPEDQRPDWLVFGAMLILSKHGAGDPGLTPGSTSMEEEGFWAAPDEVLESFARHLLRGFHLWDTEGFAVLARDYLKRLVPLYGNWPDVAENGDLLVREGGETTKLGLKGALSEVAWLEPQTGRPKF